MTTSSRLLRRSHRHCAARGVILFMVLILLLLLGLIGGGFMLVTQAESASQYNLEERISAKEAANAGTFVAIAAVRKDPYNPTSWVSNDKVFFARQVFDQAAADGEVTLRNDDPEFGQDALESELTGPAKWRFALVRTDGTSDTRPIFGILDEGAKFNLNQFTPEARDQYRQQVMALPKVTDEMADALIDWLDADSETSESGAEGDYYAQLSPPYGPRNGLLQSLDELLLVKGWTPQVLYGEDSNRNGVLDPNEDDSDASAPPDDGDGKLNRGLLPYLTIWSFESNLAATNRLRTPLSQAAMAPLRDEFDEKAEYLNYLISERVIFRSPADLLGGDLPRRPPPTPAPTQPPPSGQPPGSGDDKGGDGSPQPPTSESAEDELRRKEKEQQEMAPDGGKLNLSTAQVAPGGPPSRGGRGPGGRGSLTQEAGEKAEDLGSMPPAGGFGGRGRGRGNAPLDGPASMNGENPASPSGTPGPSGPSPTPSPTPTLKPSPFDDADLPLLMDKYTAVAAGEVYGRVNILTAPPEVLRTIPNITENAVNSIVQGRSNLSEEDRYTPAWLRTSGSLSLAEFQAIAPYITTRATVFAIDSVGFRFGSDVQHRRLTIVQVQGPLIKPLHILDYPPGQSDFDFYQIAAEGSGGTGGDLESQ